MIDSVLMVCVGNICRSPMAEGLMRRSLPGSAVSSAGLGALVGMPADPLAVELMRERDADISAHRARQIQERLISESGLVLVMELAHQRFLEAQYPVARGKIFRLCENIKADVADPYRRGRDDFEEALRLIAHGVDSWSARIKGLSAKARH